MEDNNSVKADEARDALNTAENMRAAGLKRAVPPRWFSVGIAAVVAVGFALYAQKDPGSIPGLVIALGTVFFVAANRSKSSAIGKAIPDTSSGIWALIALSLFLVVLFFGGIYVRRAFDLAWVPVVTGAVAGITLLLLSEIERRHAMAEANGGAQ